MGKAPAWTPTEIEVLRTIYVEQGLIAAMKLLPGRADGAIYQHAFKLGLKTNAQHFRTGSFMDLSEEAWRLKHQECLSYSSIGVVLGICEANATNAVLYAECVKAGHRPIERSPGGKLLPEGRDRLRVMFRKGWTHRKIQEWTGAAASMLTRERKRYAADLKTKGLAPLPPIGGGERYSGAKIPKDLKRKVEEMYLEGYGAGKISAATGVSRTHCLRTRAKLIKRLKQKGQCLPGCDIKGRRVGFKNHARAIPAESMEKLRELLLSGETVARAARLSLVGGSTAYRVYHQIKGELEADGKELPRKEWRSGPRQVKQKARYPELPGKRWGLERYRAHIHAGKSRVEAIEQTTRDWLEKAQAERAELALRRAQQKSEEQPKSFEEQLAAVERGAKLMPAFRPTKAAPDRTLGGVPTGAL